MTDTTDLGQCCACRQSGPTVRNIVCLDVRGPSPGHGWGCLVCDLPSDGAVAVVCDACLDADAPILEVCAGYPAEGKRMPRERCTEPFQHEEERHEQDHLV